MTTESGNGKKACVTRRKSCFLSLLRCKSWRGCFPYRSTEMRLGQLEIVRSVCTSFVSGFSVEEVGRAQFSLSTATYVAICIQHIFILLYNWPTTHLPHEEQWRSHWGVKGGRVPPLTAQNLPKIGKKRKKIRKKRKNWEEKAKIGKALSLCPSRQIGLATLLMRS